MEKNAEGVLVACPKDKAVDKIKNLEPGLQEKLEFDLHYIDNIDSTNMEPHYWDTMSQVIAEKYEKYDGFVITHGTDTMGYTSSALSFALQNLGKPVVLTGAQIPIVEICNDARRNFVNAMLIATQNVSGVYVVFDERIMLGARTAKVSESELDAFRTVNWDDAGQVRIDLRFNRDTPPRHNKKLTLKTGFESDIAVITITPGNDPQDIIRLLNVNELRGIVLRGYGTGNIPEPYLEVFKVAANKQVPVVVMTQCLRGATAMHHYEVGMEALKLGAIQAYDMSVECVSTKLMWALANYPYEKISEVMNTNYVGELNKEGEIY